MLTSDCPIPSLAFHGPIEGYVVNYIKKNLWRVERSMERDDVISEAFLVYARVADRYPGVEEPHFMALFKTSWHNRFCELANADTAQRELFRSSTVRDEDGEDEAGPEPLGETDNAGVALSALRQVPREVGMVLNLLVSAPQELLDVALATWESGGSRRLNQLLGFDPSYDCVAEARAHFLSV